MSDRDFTAHRVNFNRVIVRVSVPVYPEQTKSSLCEAQHILLSVDGKAKRTAAPGRAGVERERHAATELVSGRSSKDRGTHAEQRQVTDGPYYNFQLVSTHLCSNPLGPFPEHMSGNNSLQAPQPPAPLTRTILLPISPISTEDTECLTSFYGYAVTDEWLLDYAIRHEHLRQHQPGVPLRSTYASLMSFGMDLLRRRTGISTLTWEWARPQDGMPSDAVVGEDDEVVVLSVVSAEMRLTDRRPTRAQIDKLQAIMGNKKPMWWTSYDSPSN
ncbi:hypothetical protein BV25DRAFT_1051532 [Artomyces pyxidatus]|uniref:Uncharacterized protein n=1 Tax=Artomyces pyxidatus TaxID=48021 RepID=A0ACB8SUR0_9AGAM|nr:hypothetical protein BV25DRAFT_1051532 [Artomyces pyxidatus]